MNNIINDKEEYKEFHYINNKNAKGKNNGYQEWYYNNILWYRVNYKNDKEIGYEEYHFIKQTRYHIR